MKRLITLILSAALLCPIWAGAQVPNTSSTQTTVGAIGELGFLFNSAMVVEGVASGLDADGKFINGPIGLLDSMGINFFAPNNTSNYFLISGSAKASLSNSPLSSMYTPIFGSAIAGNGSILVLNITIGSYNFACSLNTTTLNGYCGSLGQPPASFTYIGKK